MIADASVRRTAAIRIDAAISALVSEPRPPDGCSPWVRPFPPRLPPGVAFLCSVASPVLWPHPTSHPRTCSACGLSPSRAGPAHRVRAWMRSPRFRAKNVSTCTRSPTARGSSHASHSPWDDVAFSSAERDRHLGIRPVSQLNTWPVVSPVNASRRPSRDAAHHSGSGRLARPYPVGDLHLLFFASFAWRTPSWVRCRGPGDVRVAVFLAQVGLGSMLSKKEF